MALKRPGDDLPRFVYTEQELGIRPGDVGVYHSRTLVTQTPAWHADFEAWKDYLQNWHVPMPVHISLSAAQNGLMVFMLMETAQPDARDPWAKPDGREQRLSIEIPVPSQAPDGNSDRWVRALLRWLVCHELDEFIRYRGQRIFDPHRGGRTPTPENS